MNTSLNKAKRFSKDTNRILLLLTYCILMLLFCSKNSPLYGWNSYSDMAIYHDIGKALHNGSVLYRDVYDHKGPIFFFLSTAVYYNRQTVFVFDLLSFGLSAIFMYKTIRQFRDSLGSVVGALVILTSTFTLFYDAGSPEEFIMALEYISLYVLISQKHTNKTWFMYGIIISYVFYTKINLVLFWAPIMIYLLYIAIKDGTWLKRMASAMIPFIAITVIVLAYFIKNNALNYFINTYFIANASYTELGDSLWWLISVVYALVGLALCGSLARKEHYTPLKIMLASVVCMSIAEISLSKHFYYYFLLVLMPILLLVFLNHRLMDRHLSILVIGIAIIASVNIAYSFVSANQYCFMQPITGDARYQFASDVGFQETRVRVIGCIGPDLTYYLPNSKEKYAVMCNMAYDTNPEMFDSALKEINNKELDYVAFVFTSDNHIALSYTASESMDAVNKIIDAVSNNYTLYKSYDLQEDGHSVKVFRRAD